MPSHLGRIVRPLWSKFAASARRCATIVTACAAAVSFFTGCAGSGGDASDPNSAVYEAWRAQRSHVEVTAAGSISRVLGLRRGPSGEHEGFLVHLRGSAGHGLTVKVEDNTDLTGAVPVREGADVEVRGEYIYDSRGGLIHYTHRDPRFHHEAGYVKIDGKIYQ